MLINLNSSNYASNISNVLLTNINLNSSNYASNISNVVLANSSNYASNISNVVLANSSNYASNISNVVLANSSNYASNISNVVLANSSNYASNISNVVLANSSNYASNISNVFLNTYGFFNKLQTLDNNSIIYNNITTLQTSITITSNSNLIVINKFALFNYTDENYIGSGTYIIFNTGNISINTTPQIVNRSYPILKDSITNTTINPIIWYKFDDNAPINFNSGTLSTSANLSSSGSSSDLDFRFSQDPETYIHGTQSALIQQLTASGLLTIPTVFNSKTIQTTTGITFAFWIKAVSVISQNGYKYSPAIIAFGLINSTCIEIKINKPDDTYTLPNSLIFNIYNSLTLSGVFTVSVSSITDWNYIVWTITNTGDWCIYINNIAASYYTINASITGPQSPYTNYFGNKSTTYNNLAGYLRMFMDDFRIYNFPLTSNQVSELYMGRVELYSKNNIGIGTTNPNSNYMLDVNGNLNSSYLYQNGNLINFDSYATNINSSNYASNISNVIITNINTNYLKLAGGSMTGPITGITNLIATTGNFNKIVNSNFTFAAPSLTTTTGGAGDKIILYPGVAETTYPWSIGINTNDLWYSVPTGVSHDFFINNVNILSLSSALTTTTVNLKIDKTDANIQLGTGANNIVVPSTNGGTSLSTLANDMVIKSVNNLVLSSGTSWAGLIIDTTCNLITSNALIFRNIRTAAPATGIGINASVGNRIILFHGSTNHPYALGISSSTLWYSVPTTAVHSFYINGLIKLNISSTGVGIGNPTTAPPTAAANLHVGAGTSTTGAIALSYFNQSTATTITNNSTAQATVCAIFDTSIWAKGAHIASSDIRIKNNIQDINDDGALQKILQIEPKTYNYIDIISRGENKVYGFIAQQIKEIIPEAVSLQTEVIPNIYKLCDCENDEIRLSNDIIISSNLNINNKIDIIDIDNNRTKYTILEILDNSIKINENLNSSNCFIYGKEVNDFHTLDKTYIFTLNVCATQELYKIIQEQNIKINALQNEITTIKQYLNLP